MTANVNAQRTIAHGPGVYRVDGLHEHMKCAQHASFTEAAFTRCLTNLSGGANARAASA